jgi:hypothetical protein
MIEELYNKLPDEVVWHVIKYLKHPIIEIIEEGILEGPYIICDMCGKIVFQKTGNWKIARFETLFYHCFITNGYDIEEEEYLEELREVFYGYSDNSDDSDVEN